MGTLLKIAWRNLGRNPRRTVITASTIAFGVALCVATYGLTDGLNVDLVRGATRLDLGHIQVHDPQYPEHRLLRKTLPPPGPLVAAALATPGVRAAAPRAYAWGLLSKGKASAGAELAGVDPALEAGVTEVFDRLPRDERLPEAATPWPEGREMTAAERARDDRITREALDAAAGELDALEPLEGGAGEKADRPKDAPGTKAPATTVDAGGRPGGDLLAELSPPPDHPPPLVIGEGLARAIDAKQGDLVYLLSSTVDGVSVQERFRVAGIFRTGTWGLDRTRAYVHLRDLQRFVRLGDRVHEVALAVDRPFEADRVAAALALRPEAAGLRVRSWDQVRPELKRMLDLNEASMGIMLVIIFLIAALGVLNTMVMAVFERSRELGMVMALGLRPWQVVRMVVYETVLLTIAGSVAGTAAGLGMDAWLLFHGWNLAAWTGGLSIGGIGLDPVLHAAVTVNGVVMPLFVMSIVGLLASFYPARRASRLQPTQAMREA